MSVAFGEGGNESLGKIKSSIRILLSDGTTSVIEYAKQLTWNDLLWAARMLWGEAKEEAATVHGAAILWTQAQAIVALNYKKSFTDYIRSHSQPINPKWAANGEFCLPGGKGYGTVHCSPKRLRRREQITNLSWENIDDSIKKLVVDWAKGKIANPVPRATDFASTSLHSLRRKLEDGRFIYVWDSKGLGLDALRNTWPKANVFVYWSRGKKNSSRWPDNHVRIELGEIVASDSSPEDVVLQTNIQTINSEPSTRRVIRNQEELIERIQAMTLGRTSAPSESKYQYFIISGKDPHSDNIFPNRASLFTPYEKYFQQMKNLRAETNLNLSKAANVLQIFTTDENNNLVDLNSEIFSSPSSENSHDEAFLDRNLRFPERPIASIEEFEISVQPPAVGGPNSISIATLRIVVHNPTIVNKHHPKGKYLSWMMRQGFVLRIRYGIGGLDINSNFTQKEEDFFISQHQIEMQNDLQMKMILTLLPAATKLLNQVNIGESIKISDIEGITSQDIESGLLAALNEDTTQEQTEELKKQLNQFHAVFNSNLEFVGTDSYRKRNGRTLGSIFHGTVSNLDIIKRPGGFDPILVRNFSEALQGIQSSLLSRRFENVMRKNAYFAKIRPGVEVIAINLGPMMYEMVLPEIEKVAEHVSDSAIAIGPVNGRSNKNRRKVKMVFGNFNANAGEWANLPISIFPIDLEDIFSYIREEREVGKFSGSVNNFIARLASLISTQTYYMGRVESVNEQQLNESSTNEVRRQTITRIEIPQIKYNFYPDPEDDSAWIFYVYDNKQYIVEISNMLHDLRQHVERPLSKEEIKEKCRQKRIPWIDLGTDSSLVKHIQATTQGDDMLMSALMWAANNGVNQRRIDGIPEVPPGISVSWLAGARTNPQRSIRTYPIIMPLQLQIDHFMTTEAFIFSHLYVFFPINEFSGLYTMYELTHSLSRHSASSKYTLQINLTDRNRINN